MPIRGGGVHTIAFGKSGHLCIDALETSETHKTRNRTAMSGRNAQSYCEKHLVSNLIAGYSQRPYTADRAIIE